MAVVVEMNGYDRVAEADVVHRFAMGLGVAFTSGEDYAPGYLSRFASSSQKIVFDASGVVSTGVDVGDIVLVNAPPGHDQPGPIDDLADIAWAGREATLWSVPTRDWGDRIFIAKAIMEQPTANIAVGGGDATLRFPLRDPRAGLETPLQDDKFLGDNDEGVGGVEGGPDLKDVVKPIVYGLNANMQGRLVDENRFIVCVADKAVTILCVRDGCAPILAGVDRVNVAALIANEPEPGYYDWASTATGTYYRLCTRPVARLAHDAEEGSEATNTHAQIWARIRTERCGTDPGDIDSASVTAVDALAPEECGFYWAEDRTQKAALDELLSSLCGYERLNDDGTWSIGQVRAPTGSGVVNLKVLQPSSVLKVTDRKIVDMTRVRPGFAPNGTPMYAYGLNWGKNNTPMTPADQLPSANTWVKAALSQQWRTEYSTDDTIWNPDTQTGAFPGAPKVVVDTGYQPGVDFKTAPHVVTEAARRHNLFKTLPGQYQVRFVPRITASAADRILIGDKVQVFHGSYGLSAGPVFLVLQSGILAENGRVLISLVVGLQAEAA